MGKDYSFLKKAEIFKGLPDTLLEDVFTKSRMTFYGPGEKIFNENDESYDIYVIRGGVVEIRKNVDQGRPPAVVAYLSVGECFGEMAMLTGRPRSATARVPEEAEVLKIPAEIFESLTNDNIFLRRLCEILALRLERTDARILDTKGKKELQGDLQYFDIGTVMQTLINSNQSGLMIIETPDHKQADILFANGKIVQARFLHLDGEDAFYQIFQENLEGKFVFEGRPVNPSSILEPITASPMNLLLEAFRMKDEIPIFLGKIKHPDRLFSIMDEPLSWEDPEDARLATIIRVKISRGSSLQQILKETPCCTYRSLTLINEMLEKGVLQ